MNTEQNTTPNTVHAIREDVVSTLTEAEVYAWLKRCLSKVKKGISERISTIQMGVNNYGDSIEENMHCLSYVYADNDGDSHCIGKHGDLLNNTLAEVTRIISSQSPYNIAKEKRAAAAALIAEAEKLEADGKTSSA